ncbi:hypothetical protein AV530_000557 [Patagioenas fasciata monilis]|uniref:Uncharacterized protein n=1 Tax=Patagioenas fasciata monilis TaxID=372326 RepID=A0A1V4IFM5_PATFA|nr:hypothetical protein AV530_000557 [Patagioenas fasciata monilis]
MTSYSCCQNLDQNTESTEEWKRTMMISHLLQKDAIAKTNLQPCMKLMTSPFWTDVQTDAGEKVKGVCAKPDGTEYYPGPAKRRFSPSI